MNRRRTATWNRRAFIRMAASVGLVSCSPAASHRRLHDVNETQRGHLAAVLDAIIPSNEGMPSAVQAGGVDYLTRLAAQYPRVQNEMHESLTALEQTSRALFGKPFEDLAASDRPVVLSEMEKRSAPKLFSAMLGYVYEAYYAQPAVTRLLIGSMRDSQDEFPDALLEPVRHIGHPHRTSE